MIIRIGVDKDTCLSDSVETIAANVHDLTPAVDLLRGEVVVGYVDAGHQRIENREEMEGKRIQFWIATRLGKRRALPDTPDGHLECLMESAKARIWAKIFHLFRVIKQQFGFSKTRLRVMTKNLCMINVVAALTNLFLACCKMLMTG